MNHIYREKTAIPIPEGFRIKPSDGRVEVYVDVNGVKKALQMGCCATKYTMYVNDTFRDMFPDLWIKYYGKEDIRPDRLYIGCYALTLGIIHKTGLYTLLLKAFDPGPTNAILDYVMYSILDRSDATQSYPERMQDEVLFSNGVVSDSWYSDFFSTKLTKEMVHDFRLSWLVHCKEKGITKAWISIDGTKDDCEITENDLSEYGYAEPHNNSDIVSFIYAVNAEDGRPITYSVNPGSLVDSNAFMEIAGLLKEVSIEIEGIILDSAFCQYELIRTIQGCGYEYAIMTPCDTYGHKEVMTSEGNSIRWKSKYCVSDDGSIFGTSKQHVLFQNHPDLEAYINLYYDGLRGAHQSAAFISDLREEMTAVQKKLDEGKPAPLKSEFTSYLRKEVIDGRETAVPNYDKWDTQMSKKGFFSIAASKDFGAEKTLQIYHLRNTSAVGYCFAKSHQGFDALRIHSTEGIESKLAICFIGNIIRQEIYLACKAASLDTDGMIQKLDQVYLRRGLSNSYSDAKMLSNDHKTLFAAFNIEPADFEHFAADVNKRLNTTSNNVHLLPDHESTPVTIKKTSGRGRTPGSKNKKTLEKEAAIKAMILSGIDPSTLIPPKNPVGRPKDRKDSKPRKRRTKAEIEADRAAKENMGTDQSSN